MAALLFGNMPLSIKMKSVHLFWKEFSPSDRLDLKIPY
jgi:hypothetical protein